MRKVFLLGESFFVVNVFVMACRSMDVRGGWAYGFTFLIKCAVFWGILQGLFSDFVIIEGFSMLYFNSK